MSLLDFLNPVSGIAKSIEGITKAITDAKVERERLEAEKANNEQRIAAEERVKSLELQRDVLIAEAQRERPGINETTRTVFLATPVGILLFKVLVWDLAFGQWTAGHTDLARMPQELWVIIGSIIGYYTVARVTDAIERIWSRR